MRVSDGLCFLGILCAKNPRIFLKSDARLLWFQNFQKCEKRTVVTLAFNKIRSILYISQSGDNP